MAKLLTQEEYKSLKEKAYLKAAALSEKNLNIEEFEKEIAEEVKKIEDANSKIIFEYTVKYPNDTDLYWEYKNNNKNINNIRYLYTKYNLPFKVAVTKIYEINSYGLIRLLAENDNLRKLAEQASYYEIKGNHR